MAKKTLVVDIRTRTQQFQQSVRSIDKQLSQLDRKINSFSRSAKGLGISLIAGFSISAVISSINETTRSLDELNKISQQSHVTTSFLQEFSYVAERSGVSANEANQYIKTFAKTFANFKGGYGTLFENVSKNNGFGSLFGDLQKITSTEVAIKRVFKAIREAKTETEQLRIATSAFGDSATRAILVAQDYEKLSKTAHELGLIKPPEFFEKASEYQDKLTDINRVLEAQKDELKLELSPAYSFVLNYVNDAIKLFKILGQTVRIAASDIKELNGIEFDIKYQNLIDEQQRLRDNITRTLDGREYGDLYFWEKRDVDDFLEQLNEVNDKIEAADKRRKDLIEKRIKDERELLEKQRKQQRAQVRGEGLQLVDNLLDPNKKAREQHLANLQKLKAIKDELGDVKYQRAIAAENQRYEKQIQLGQKLTSVHQQLNEEKKRALSFASTFVPPEFTYIDQYANLLKNKQAIIKEIQQGRFDTILPGEIFDFDTGKFTNRIDEAKRVQMVWEQIVQKAQSEFAPFENDQKLIDRYNPLVAKLRSINEDIQAIQHSLQDVNRDLSKELTPERASNLKSLKDDLEKSLTKAQQERKQLEQQYELENDPAKKRIFDLKKEAEELNKTVDIRSPYEKMVDDFEHLQELYAQGLDTDVFNAKIREISDEYKRAMKDMERSTDNFAKRAD